VKRTSTALRGHLAAKYQTVARCARIEKTSGEVLRFTDLDRGLTISGWADPDDALNGTYVAYAGFKATDISTTSALNVDNLEIEAPQVSPAPLEAGIHAGEWDGAAVTIFLVNYSDLTMGPHYLRVGHLGELSTKTGATRNELRGLMQAYTKTLGSLTSPTCRNTFGDSKCQVDLGPLTVTGSVTSVTDTLNVLDTSRTEPGASDGVAVTGITNADPGVVTMADNTLNLHDGQAVVISGVGGMRNVNGVTYARNPSGNTFELGIDTSDTAAYSPYTSGGTVAALGGGRSAYDGGVITMTSGANAGLSRQVKTFTTGQITLGLPLPYALQIGDTYSLSAGCGKDFFADCVGGYDNSINFNGEPYVRGLDQLVQVGRHD